MSEKNNDVQEFDEVQTEQKMQEKEEQQMQAKAADIIQAASELSSVAMEKAEGKIEVTEGEDGDDNGGKVTQTISNSFVGLPIEALIGKPFIAAARSQQELTTIYVDTVMGLVYGKSDTEAKDNKDDKKVNTLTLKANRPVITKEGTMSSTTVKVEAPLLPLVPIPAFTMDEVVVDFNMEIKTSSTSESKNHADAATKLGYKSWFGLNAEITGNITSDSTHKRSTDSSATYTIHARAVQQPPTEGMAKLNSILASFMEPIDLRGTEKQSK